MEEITKHAEDRKQGRVNLARLSTVLQLQEILSNKLQPGKIPKTDQISARRHSVLRSTLVYLRQPIQYVNDSIVITRSITTTISQTLAIL